MADGEAIIARAKDEGRALLEQVQEARRRVLADLASRRRGLGIQIEQLRAARDEMAASVHGVRDRVDGILAHLDRTDEEARAAAQAVGDQFRLHGAGEASPRPGRGRDVPGEQPLAGTGPTEGGDEAGDGEDDHTGPPAVAPSVDELFARIRAGSESGAPAPEATADDTVAVTVVETPVAGGEDGGAAEASGEAEAEPAEADAPPGPDDALIARRDELLGPVTGAAEPHGQARPGRRPEPVARPVAQRAVAERRRAPRAPRRSTSPCSPLRRAAIWREAFAAGTAFAGARCSGRARERRRRAVGGGPGARDRDDAAAPDGGRGLASSADRVGAAFREWRGERVERLAGDYATQAFSAGVTAAARGRQGALGGHVRRRVLGLRGQRPGRRGQRGRDLPDGSRAPARRTRAAAASWRRRTTEETFSLLRGSRPGRWGRGDGR